MRRSEDSQSIASRLQRLLSSPYCVAHHFTQGKNCVRCHHTSYVCLLQMSPATSQSKYRRYSQAALVDAVTAVVIHKMTSNQASRFFKVPRSTVRFQVSKLSLKMTAANDRDKRRRSVSMSGGDETDSPGQEPTETVAPREHDANS